MEVSPWAAPALPFVEGPRLPSWDQCLILYIRLCLWVQVCSTVLNLHRQTPKRSHSRECVVFAGRRSTLGVSVCVCLSVRL